MSESQLSDEQLAVVYYHGAYPLWAYLKETFGINITEVCPRVAKDEPILKTACGQLVPRVVDNTYDIKLDSIFNNDIIFLINSINVVFESLKSGVEKDGVKILESFQFKLDSNQNMYLASIENNEAVSRKVIAIMKID